MAFDRPLEADQVDDLNLFSLLLRAPVLGTLMWFLGGDASRKEEEAARRRQDMLSFSECKTHSSDASLTATSRSSKARPRKSALKKKCPINSEVSEFGDLCEYGGISNASALQHEDLDITRNTSDSSSCSSSNAQHSSLKQRKKELSWSDESGHELVKYDNEVRISNWRCLSVSKLFWLVRIGYFPSSRWNDVLLIVECFIAVMTILCEIHCEELFVDGIATMVH
jgi:hypothetical protein